MRPGLSCIALAAALSCVIDADDRDPTTAAAQTSDDSSSASTAESTTSDTAGHVQCEPTTEGVREAVFEPTCNRMGCHSAASLAGGLDLSADLEAALVGVASSTCTGQILVVAGDPDASFLVAKLRDTPTCGTPMPVGQELAPELVTCIADWIATLQPSCETCGTATCVDVTSDAMHCGACETACPAGIACVDGQCACPSGTELCAGACVNPQTDPSHCGGCDTACDAGLVCLNGACSASCGEVLTACEGACIDPVTDAQHCGDCSTACAPDETCVAGVCTCDGADLSYAADIEPILLAGSCTMMGCHGGVMPAEGLDLRMGNGYGDLVGVPSGQCGERMRVAPGSPSESYLLDKLEGVNLCFGSKMPKMGQGPSAAEITAISQWICSGASP